VARRPRRERRDRDSVDSGGRDTILACRTRRSPSKLVGLRRGARRSSPTPPRCTRASACCRSTSRSRRSSRSSTSAARAACPPRRSAIASPILIQFKDSMPPNTRVAKENFKLFCSPVVNLFEHPTDPIKPDVTKHEYLARPSGGTPSGVRDLLRRQRHRHRPAHEPAREDPVVLHVRARARPRRRGARRLLPEPPAPGRGGRRRRRTYLSFGSPAGRKARCPTSTSSASTPPAPTVACPPSSRSAICASPRRPRPRSRRSPTSTGVTQPLPPPIGRELSGACSRTWP
jgi:hypothetical protein